MAFVFAHQARIPKSECRGACVGIDRDPKEGASKTTEGFLQRSWESDLIKSNVSPLRSA